MENSSSQSLSESFTTKPYHPPSWASHLSPVPSHTVSLGRLPTPIHKWNLPNLPKGTEVWIKRDDLSGMQLSGNKARKLEFLMADAAREGADCVVTIGSLQSNSCRAAAVSAKYLNIDCYLILATSAELEKDPGFEGNLLITRLVGAHIDLVSSEDYSNIGTEALLNLKKQELLNKGRRPYVVPAGGSTPVGTWGYIEAIREIEEQYQNQGIGRKFDDIIVSCGSASTVTGLSVGSWLSSLKARVTGFSISNDPDYYYEYIQGLLDRINAGINVHDIVEIKDAKGLGYSQNTPEELKFLKQVGEATGVVLDHVYGGKAAYAMMKDMREKPSTWEGRKVLFIHTGGLLGLYAITDELAAIIGNCCKMDIDESIPRQPGIGKWV